jgi:hypothetical protein
MGKCLQLKLQDDYDIDSRLILDYGRKLSKGMRQAQTTLQKCFPFYTKVVRGGADSNDEKTKRGEKVDSTSLSTVVLQYSIPQRATARTIERTLEVVKQKISNASANTTTIIKLHARSMFIPNSWMDRYFDALKEYFVMNQTKCCNSFNDIPQPTENVYHYRNFMHEMFLREKNYIDNGWHELSPRQSAVELFGYLKKNNSDDDNNNDTAVTNNTNTNTADTSEARAATGIPLPPPVITVISRFENAGIMAQLEALKNQGFDARLLSQYHPTNNTNTSYDVPSRWPGMQDFCYLMQAQGDIAGMARSTFYRYASLFGTSHRSWWIVVDTPQLRDKLGDEWYTFQHEYNWSHPILKGRIRHRIFLQDVETENRRFR